MRKRKKLRTFMHSARKHSVVQREECEGDTVEERFVPRERSGRKEFFDLRKAIPQRVSVDMEKVRSFFAGTVAFQKDFQCLAEVGVMFAIERGQRFKQRSERCKILFSHWMIVET